MTATSESFNLRVGGIFLIFSVSLIGFFLPSFFKHYGGIENLQDDSYFLLLKSFAAGTILGVAMLHLLNDAVIDLADYTDYPLGLALAVAGIVATLGLDQIAMYIIQKKPFPGVDSDETHNHRHHDRLEVVSFINADDKNNLMVKNKQMTHSHDHNDNHSKVVGNTHSYTSPEHSPVTIDTEEKDQHNNHNNNHHHSHHTDTNPMNITNNSTNTDKTIGNTSKSTHSNEDNTSIEAPSSSSVKKHDIDIIHDGVTQHAHDHTHTHTMLMVTDENANRAFIKTMVLELSIAIHSIIIGVSFGGLGTSQIATIKVLMAAIAFHQFFEGVSLGAAITESNLRFSTTVFFALVFSFSFTVGGIIGITSESNSTGVFVQGCFNAFAAGSLIYSALVEMMAEDFSSSELNDRPWLKSVMYLFLCLGCVGMAVLAMYA